MKILCSGLVVRHPVSGQTWHHLQYLIGLHQLGHEMIYFEDFGWPGSCYDPSRDAMTGDPTYGLGYLLDLLRPFGLERQWCYLAEDGSAHGMSRAQLERECRECDVYLDISNLNAIPELEECRRRVLIDTDPVFTQIGALGAGGPFTSYHARFTFGVNVGRPGCEMPTAGVRWMPTRQPIVLSLWPVTPGSRAAPFTTIANWSSIGGYDHDGRVYRGKSSQFAPYYTLPHDSGEPMALALGGIRQADAALDPLRAGGWQLADPIAVSRTLATYQQFIVRSRAEFSIAKHAYVVTRCGWFSDRSAAYLASGRPVILQDTGFSDWLPVGAGLLAFDGREPAVAAMREVSARYVFHCRAARALAEEHFDSRCVLSALLDQAMDSSWDQPLAMAR